MQAKALPLYVHSGPYLSSMKVVVRIAGHRGTAQCAKAAAVGNLTPNMGDIARIIDGYSS
jgi:hypothetical protein